ncbi:MAG TPA: PEGA domain-containing protein [Polyangia bacterium]
MRPRWLGLIPLAFCALYPGMSHASGDGPPTAVLGLEAIDVPATLVDQISEELRQRVSAASDLRLVSGKDLVELKLVFACADEGHACMGQVGKSLDAERLIYGSVKKAGGDYAVWLKLFDVRKEKVDAWLTETLPAAQADGPAIKSAVGRWFAKLTGHPVNAGMILVSANLLGAVVTLDGIPVGATAEHPLTIPDVKPGQHEVVLTKAGNAPARQQFVVTAGQTVSVNLALHADAAAVAAAPAAEASPVPPAPPPVVTPVQRPNRGDDFATDRTTDSGRNGYRTGFWVTLGAGLVSAGVAVKFGLDVLKINKDLDQFRRYPCATDPSMSCNAMGKVAPLTDSDRTLRDSKISQGEHDRNLQWVFIGIGSALGITSAYLLYKGYLDADDAPVHHEAMSGLRIFPTAGMSSGGVQAEFDF